MGLLVALSRGGEKVDRAALSPGETVALTIDAAPFEPIETAAEGADWAATLDGLPAPLRAGAKLRVGDALLCWPTDGPAIVETPADLSPGAPAMLTDLTAAWPAVLDFWLNRVGRQGWYLADPAVDLAIARAFADLVDAARIGALQSWLDTPQSALALLVTLDQFPRNLHRSDGRAFACDPMARAVAERAIAAGHDLATPEQERQFFYMPFEHSEDIADQDRAVDLLQERCPNLAETHHHAEKHRELIRRFGRFPHRNEALGRTPTDDERRFLAEGGYRPGAAPKR